MPLSGGLDEHTSAHDNGDPRVGEASNLTTQGTLRHEELKKAASHTDPHNEPS